MRNIRRSIVPLLLLAASIAHAAYLKDVPQVVVQPNGDTLRCFATGDEFYNWMHDANNYTIIQDPASGYYVYAELRNNVLVPTRYIPSIDDPAGAGLARGVNLPPDRILSKRESSILQSTLQVSNAPKTGTINNIVVFIRFSDEGEFSVPISAYDDVFNSNTAGANSMRRFFNELSYGALTVSTIFFPSPGGGMVVSYQDIHPRSYYQPYSVTNPGGYQGGDNGSERTSREHTLLRDALNAVSPQIPGSLNLDGDNDGYVDNVCFIISGSPTAWATLLWPHMWGLFSYTVTLNGKTVGSYNFNIQSMAGNSVLSHEMGHSLGAPDLYRYAYNGLPVGSWDLMGYNSNPPQHMGAYMKMKYGTWISGIPTITTPGTYTLNPLTSATNNAYRIPSPNSTNEFFIVEYRKREGTFESSLPGEGLLVYRINSYYHGNAGGPPDEVYIYRPGGTPSNDGSVSSAAFSSNSGRTRINDTSDPSSFLTDGSPGGLDIYNVTAIGPTMSFDVDFQSPPLISGIDPPAGSAGTAVTISGDHFSPVPDGNVVRFGPVTAQVLSATEFSLDVIVPPGAAFGYVTVTSSGLTAWSPSKFVVTFPTSDTLGSGSFQGRFDISPGKSVSIGDFDADGRADIVSANSAGDVVTIRRNVGDAGNLGAASFESPVNLATGSWPFSLATVDLDGDGRLDLVVANEVGNSLSVYRNTTPSPGGITFDARQDFATGTTPWGISSGDLNMDGKADLAFSNHGSNTYSVYLNTSGPGTISFASRLDYATETSPRGTTIGDLDGDRLPEVIVSNSGSNSLSIFRNTTATGTLSFAARVNIATGTGPVNSGIGDLDRDGLPDLVVGNATANTLSLLRNLSSPGSLSFSPKLDLTGGGKHAALGDLNGDGSLDIAAAAGSSNTMVTFRNRSTPGSLAFSQVGSHATGTNPWNNVITDLDGDGKPDLVSCNGTANTLSIIPNVMRAPTVQVTIGTDPPEYNGRLRFWVDGILYDSTQTFGWTAGSLHTIEADTAQYDGTLSRIIWSHWSDSGSIGHQVSATSDTSFIASFRKQHYVNTGGYWPAPISNDPQRCVVVVTPFDGWYDEGETFDLHCYIGGCEMVFSHWIGSGPGSYSGMLNPSSINILGPITEEPIFTYCNYTFSPPETTFSVSGGRGTIHVTADADSCYWRILGNDTWIQVDSIYYGSGNGSVGYTVLPNQDTIPRSARIDAEGLSYRPYWGVSVYQAGTDADQIQVVVETDPPGLEILVGDGRYTAPHTFTWIKNTPIYIGATTTQQGDTGTRHIFRHWSDAGAWHHSITPTTNSTYTATFRTEYYLDLRDSMDMGCWMSPGDGWYLKDTCLEIYFPGCDAGGPIDFSQWTGYGEGSYSGTNNPAEICMSGPITEVAYFVYCTLTGLSQYDTTFDHNGGTGSVTVLGRSCAQYSAWFNDTGWAEIDTNDFGYAGAVIPYSIQPNPDSVDRFITLYVFHNTSHSVPFELLITQKGIPLCAGLAIDSSLTASAGSSVWVDVSLAPDTLRIGSIDFTVGFDTTILTYADSFIVHPIVPASAGWIVDVNGSNPAGQVTLGAFDAVGVTNPLVGAGPIVSLKFNVASGATPGSTTPLTFTSAAATDTGVRMICVTTSNGLLTVPVEYDISGTLRYFHHSKSIIGDSIDLFNTAFPAPRSQTSSPSYTFLDVPAQGRDSLQPRGVPGLFPQPGTITSGDALKAFRGRSGGPSPLTTGFQLIAADANGDGAISSGDALAILKRATGSFRNFQGFGLGDWKYTDSSFAISTSNWRTAPGHISLAGLNGDLHNLSFIGVIRGDVDGSFGTIPDAIPEGMIAQWRSGNDVVFSIPDTLIGRPGDTITVPLIIDPASQPVGSLDATISYDSTVLGYLDSFAVGPVIPAPSGWVFDAFHDANNGTLTVAAVNFGEPGDTLAGSGILTSFRFRIRDAAMVGDTSLIAIRSEAATDTSASALATTTLDGRLRIVAELIPLRTTLLFPPDDGPAVERNIELRWSTSVYAGSHHLQVSADSTFQSTILNDSSITDTVYALSNLPPSSRFHWRIRGVNSTGPGEWSDPWRFTTTDDASLTVGVASGWNILSLPLEVADSTKTLLFPDATSNAFAFESGYVQKSQLARGVGYWMKFPSDAGVSIEGSLLGPLHIPIVEGWNLIGGGSTDIPVSAITSTPSGIITGNFFGYHGGYAPETVLEPGNGYWVKSTQNGVLHLDPTGTAGAGTRISIVPTGELPPAPPRDEIFSAEIPVDFFLGRSYPNPFNPTVVIEYGLPGRSAVSIVVYDVLGRTVGILVDEIQDAGVRIVRWNGGASPAGVYFYRMKAEGMDGGGRFDRTEKMLLLK